MRCSGSVEEEGSIVTDAPPPQGQIAAAPDAGRGTLNLGMRPRFVFGGRSAQLPRPASVPRGARAFADAPTSHAAFSPDAGRSSQARGAFVGSTGRAPGDVGEAPGTSSGSPQSPDQSVTFAFAPVPCSTPDVAFAPPMRGHAHPRTQHERRTSENRAGVRKNIPRRGPARFRAKTRSPRVRDHSCAVRRAT
jgi:hypothetical protein